MDGSLSQDVTLAWGGGAIANPEPAPQGATVEHAGVSGVEPGRVRLEGRWIHHPDHLEWAGAAGAPGGLTITNHAATVRLEASSKDGAPLKVAVNEDGPPLDREWCGADCDEDAEFGAATQVGERREYEIVKRGEAETHELQFVPVRPGLRVYAIRFA